MYISLENKLNFGQITFLLFEINPSRSQVAV